MSQDRLTFHRDQQLQDLIRYILLEIEHKQSPVIGKKTVMLNQLELVWNTFFDEETTHHNVSPVFLSWW